MRLRAVRCTNCGDVRWYLFTTADAEQPCELCGGEMRIERRSPGAGPRTLAFERRTASPGAPPRAARALGDLDAALRGG